MSADTFDLHRFIDAQASVWKDVLDELRKGRKRTHWMWFIFPQMRGLGSSEMADRYGIGGLDEAAAYVGHPLLGARLAEATRLLLAVPEGSARQILGSPDDLKLRSSMTLFDVVAPDGVFDAALRRFFGGVRDVLTLDLLAR